MMARHRSVQSIIRENEDLFFLPEVRELIKDTFLRMEGDSEI